MSAPVGNEWSHSFLVGTFFWKQKQACLSSTKSFQRPGDAGARRGASTDLQAPPGPHPVKRLRAGSSPPKPGMNHLNLTEAFGHGIAHLIYPHEEVCWESTKQGSGRTSEDTLFLLSPWQKDSPNYLLPSHSHDASHLRAFQITLLLQVLDVGENRVGLFITESKFNPERYLRWCQAL